MPIEVEVPDTKSVIEFPDDTPDLEIDRAVKQHIQEWKAQNAPGPKISAGKRPKDRSIFSPSDWYDSAKEAVMGSVNEGETLLSRLLSPKPSDQTLAALDKNQESIFKTPAVRPEVFTPNPGVTRSLAKFSGSLTTPENALLMGATGAAGRIAKLAPGAAKFAQAAESVTGAERAGELVSAVGEGARSLFGVSMAGGGAGALKDYAGHVAKTGPSGLIDPVGRERLTDAVLTLGASAVTAKPQIAIDAVRGTGKAINRMLPKKPDIVTPDSPPPAIPPQVIPEGTPTDFYSEGRMAPAIATKAVQTPKTPLPVVSAPKLPPAKPVLTPATESVTAKPAEATAGALKPQLEATSRANVPSGDNYLLETAKSAKTAEAETSSGDPYATEWGGMEQPPTPASTRQALTSAPETPLPVEKSSIPEDSSIYLGSLFGGFQSLLNRAASGNLSNKFITTVVDKTRNAANTMERYGMDYAIDARTRDEKSGLDLSKPADLDQSVWVGMRQHPGSMSAAARQIYKLEAMHKGHAKELKQMGKAEGLDRKTTRSLFGLSQRWAQARRLVTDIASNYPNYEYPEGKSLQEWQQVKADIETQVGPKIAKKFEEQANQMRDTNWDIMYNILVKPYWTPGKPGMMSEKEFADMKAKHPNYVSLERMFENLPKDSPYHMSNGKFSTPNLHTIKLIKEGSDAALGDNIGAAYKALMASVELAHRNSVVQKMANTWTKTGGDVLPVKEWYQPTRNQIKIGYKEDGQTKYLALPRDYAPMIQRMDKVKVDKWIETVGAFTGFFRDMVTMHPSFMIANVGRDFMTAMWTLQNGTAFSPKTFHDYSKAMAGSMLRGVTDKADQMHMQYLESFGAGSGMHEFMRHGSAQNRNIERIAGKGKISNIPGKLWSGWQSVGETGELVPRMMAMRKALENGESLYVAGWRARNSTVDFASHGMSETLNTLRYAIPFLGARIQGIRTLYTTGGEAVKQFPGVKQIGKMAGVTPSRLTSAGIRNAGVVAGTVYMLSVWSQLHNLILFPDQYKAADKDKMDNYLVWMSGAKDARGRYKTLLPNYPIQEFAPVNEAGKYFATWLTYHHPETAAQLLNSFYSKAGGYLPTVPGKPREQVKPDLKGSVLNAAGSAVPLPFMQHGEPSLGEFVSSATGIFQAPAILATGIDLRTGRSLDSYQSGFPRDRAEVKTRPSSILLSEGVNKAADFLQGNHPVGSLEWKKAQDSAWRSPNVLQRGVESLTGRLPLDLMDSGIRAANNLSDKSAPLFRDPAVESGLGPEGIVGGIKARFTTVPPSNYNSDSAAIMRAEKMAHESDNRKLSDAATRFTNLIRNEKPDEAMQFLEKFIGELDPNDKTSRDYVTKKINDGLKQLETERIVKEHNEQNPDQQMGLYTRDEVQLKRQSAAVRAAVFYEKIKDLDETQQDALINEWNTKGLFGGNFQEELGKIAVKEQKIQR